jgi:phenylalanyl-tRNA synthetase alpha chain
MVELNEENLLKFKKNFLKELSTLKKDDVESFELKYFSRKGEIRKLFQQLPLLSLEEKKKFGEKLNLLSEELKTFFEQKKKELLYNNEVKTFQETRFLEKTLPGKKFLYGNIHPLQKVLDEMIEIFRTLGFVVETGPEIESEEYNFTKLNIPEDHPARDMQDTLYLDLPSTYQGKKVLRTHTSPVQIRTMLSKPLPIKAIMPGRVYRRDNVDATHQFNFHQIEGLVVDKDVRLSDLKGVLNYFVKSFFGLEYNNNFNEKTISRFRQSYFPFTEPSLEMDMKCLICKGSGCPVCKNSGYIELLGCGMVHPQVLKNVNIDPEIYTGFAFGIGVERVAMLKYGIDDMRLFYTNDLRFLKQF